MNDALADAFRHSAWATREMLRFCGALSQEQLSARATATYGSILETLAHMVGSDDYYHSLFAGRFVSATWDESRTSSLSVLEEVSEQLATAWEELLSHPFDANAILVQPDRSGGQRSEPAGIVLAQALHHASVHREQVNMILTSLGVEPPDLDVWSYGTAMRLRPPA